MGIKNFDEVKVGDTLRIIHRETKYSRVLMRDRGYIFRTLTITVKGVFDDVLLITVDYDTPQLIKLSQWHKLKINPRSWEE